LWNCAFVGVKKVSNVVKDYAALWPKTAQSDWIYEQGIETSA
jgi:hypothetical protein